MKRGDLKPNVNLLRELRCGAGLSCADLATQAGISRSGLYKIEKSARLVCPGTAKKICGVLGVNVLDVFELVE